MDDIDSVLFSKLVRDKSLRHPTARNFGPEEWVAAAKTITVPSTRDIRLLLAAIYYGNEISILRRTFEPELFADLDRRAATLLTIAMANYNFITLTDKTLEARKKGGKDFIHLGLAGQTAIEIGYPGNHSSPDSAITAIVDTLPHCLERANRCPEHSTSTKANYWTLGTKLFSTMSIEHCLRDMWQAVLWENWEFVRDENDNRHHQPVDRQLATLWHVWSWRHEMILSQGTNTDALVEKRRQLRGQNPNPFVSPTAIGIGGNSPETRKFQLGEVSGRTLRQSWHRSEQSILQDSYLAPFLDAPLPAVSNALSCRDLQRIWCVVRDCTNVLSDRTKHRSFSELDDVEAFALLIRREEIHRAVSHCTDIDPDRTKLAIEFLTCDHFEMGSLFTQSFWSAPFLNMDGGRNLAIVSASVEVGSAIRRVEGWLNRAGLSDHLSDAQRGLRYEASVRAEIKDGLSQNFLLTNARSTTHSIRHPDGEQIDLLVMLGNLLIVGEVKCFLYPIEPIEHFNYLKKLQDAGTQATRKAKWLHENPQVVAKELQISADLAASLRAVPIVVTNQGAGFGLEAGGARVIDFHFLDLYLSEGEYISGMTFDAEKGVAVRFPETLYKDEREVANRFESTMTHPPPLQRLIHSADWKDNHFPSSDGTDLLVANCYPDDSMVSEAQERAKELGFIRQSRRTERKNTR